MAHGGVVWRITRAGAAWRCARPRPSIATFMRRCVQTAQARAPRAQSPMPAQSAKRSRTAEPTVDRRNGLRPTRSRRRSVLHRAVDGCRTPNERPGRPLPPERGHRDRERKARGPTVEAQRRSATSSRQTPRTRIRLPDRRRPSAALGRLRTGARAGNHLLAHGLERGLRPTPQSLP